MVNAAESGAIIRRASVPVKCCALVGIAQTRSHWPFIRHVTGPQKGLVHAMIDMAGGRSQGEMQSTETKTIAMASPHRARRIACAILATFLAPVCSNAGDGNDVLLHATSGEEALEVVTQAHATQSPIAAAYVDIRMPPGIDGIETIRRIRGIDRHVEIIIMTAYTDQRFEDIVQNMELLHKLLYIRKPFAREEIQQITPSLVSKWNMERELHASRSQVRHLRSELQRLRDESQGS